MENAKGVESFSPALRRYAGRLPNKMANPERVLSTRQ
jgi:hypothetical protein